MVASVRAEAGIRTPFDHTSMTSHQILAAWSQHETELRRWLFSRTPVKADVDDLLQEVFIKTLRQGERWKTVTRPRAWLFEVARNTLIDHVRSAHEHLPLPDDLDTWPERGDGALAVDALAQACLPRVLSELAPRDREAIELCDLEGMAQADFARLKNLSLPAAKSRVQRARRRMRERMTIACQICFDGAGRIEDFVPREPLPDDCCSGSTGLESNGHSR
jgi:RNA polymerase sigma-70 factor, ECF subfamily